MIHAGDTLYNPVTGESMTFITTSRQTGGEYVEIELSADPDSFVAAAHVHPAQTETFKVLEGTLTAKVDGTLHRQVPARLSWSSPARRTSGGTPTTRDSCSGVRSGRHFSSSR
jgi:hypothetical protein